MFPKKGQTIGQGCGLGLQQRGESNLRARSSKYDQDREVAQPKTEYVDNARGLDDQRQLEDQALCLLLHTKLQIAPLVFESKT